MFVREITELYMEDKDTKEKKEEEKTLRKT